MPWQVGGKNHQSEALLLPKSKQNPQAGFRNGHRCEDQLFRLSQKIIDGFHEKKSTTAVFVDLQQAYDRVWRKGLLFKMQTLGIKGKLYNWIKNFLTNRINQHQTDPDQNQKGQTLALICYLLKIVISWNPELIKPSAETWSYVWGTY